MKPHQFIDKRGRYVTVDKSSKIAQFAEVYIDSPFYTGILEFMCLDEPLCDVVLGNLPAIVSQPKDFLHVSPNSSEDKSENKPQQTTHANIYNSDNSPKSTVTNEGNSDDKKEKKQQSKQANVNIVSDSNLKSSVPGTIINGSATNIQSVKNNAAAVTARSQAKEESKPKEPLKVPALPELGDRADFKEKQQKDPTLHQARKWAEKKKSKVSEKTKAATTFQDNPRVTLQNHLLNRD